MSRRLRLRFMRVHFDNYCASKLLISVLRLRDSGSDDRGRHQSTHACIDTSYLHNMRTENSAVSNTDSRTQVQILRGFSRLLLYYGFFFFVVKNFLFNLLQ